MNSEAINKEAKPGGQRLNWREWQEAEPSLGPIPQQSPHVRLPRTHSSTRLGALHFTDEAESQSCATEHPTS